MVHNDLLVLCQLQVKLYAVARFHSCLKACHGVFRHGKIFFVQAAVGVVIFFHLGKIAARRSRRNAEKPRQKAQTYNNQYDQNSQNHFYPLLYFLSLFRHLDFFQLFAVLQRRGVVFGAEYFDEIAHGVKATVHGNVEHAQICGGEQLQRVA